MVSKRFILIFLLYVEFLLLSALIPQGYSQNPSCKQINSLETCSWIDYMSWHPGTDPKSVDEAIGKVAKGIKDEDCRWAYIAFNCASSFPKANENQDGPLPVCRDTCEELITKCPANLWKGVTEQICNALPEIECTSPANFTFPSAVLIYSMFLIIAIFALYQDRR